MAIFDVVVNTDDLVVLGPPDVIDLSVSIGQQGNRGATFYAGAGNPNDSAVSQTVFGTTVTPVVGDIFINTAIGPEYGWLYIYNPKVVGNAWDQVLSLQPTIFAKSFQRTFASGEAQVSIPLTDILPPNVTQNNPDNYIINVSPIFTNPCVLTVKGKTILSGNLDITLTAAKFVSSTWSAMNESLTFSISITVI